jgi:neutral ceramidase
MLRASIMALCLQSFVACSHALKVFSPSRGDPIVIASYRLPTTQTPNPHPIAGVAKVDMTPPAGFPTGGHGPAGALARGYWARLFVRALFFADKSGSPLILVSFDSFAVPGGLSAAVSQKIVERWSNEGLRIPPDAIVIAATHTHQGPGNYLTAGAYNQYGSKYPGFDKRLFDFLVDRTVTAIDSAIRDARRGDQASILLHTGVVRDGLLMNRSPDTFLANWNAQQLMNQLNPKMVDCRPILEIGEARENWDDHGCPRLRSIDRTATILEIRRGGSRIGLGLFLAVHPTVLEHHTPFFSSDFVGAAMSSLERESTTAPFVAAFFNGAEGDVVPRRGNRDLRDARRLQDSLLSNVKAILSLPGSVLDISGITATKAFLVPGEEYQSGPIAKIQLPKSPMMGAAGLGGSEDDRTPLYQLGWNEGHYEIPSDGQGGKLGALDSQLYPIRLTHILAPDYAFPRQLPITYVQFGHLRLAALPAELSTASGIMLRQQFGPHGRFEIIGMANEYTSYVATPDEYAIQDYMAASTIWGPREMPTFAWAIECLSNTRPRSDKCLSLVHKTKDLVPASTFFPGDIPEKLWKLKGFQFGPSAIGELLNAPDDQLHTLLRNSNGLPERNLPTFEWTEVVGSDSADFASASERQIRILERRGTQWALRRLPGTSVIDDDGGSNFLTLLRETRASGSKLRERRWATIWLAPILETTPLTGKYQFEVVVTRRNGVAKFTSCSFQVNLSPDKRSGPIPPQDSLCAK